MAIISFLELTDDVCFYSEVALEALSMMQKHSKPWKFVIFSIQNLFLAPPQKKNLKPKGVFDPHPHPRPALSYAVVTPLRKAASYEQRKTNLGSSP